MKTFVFILSLLVLFSCGNETEESNGESIDMNGPDIEINVLDFDVASRKTNVEFINRLDEGIKNISATLYFYDESGAEITYATGASKSSPFSKSSNPNIVGSKSKTTFKLGNKIPENTDKVEVKDIKIKTVSGKEIVVE